MTDVERSLDESRKRKIDSLLTILDKSKFIPTASLRSSTFAPWDRSSLSSRLATFRAYPIHTSSSLINAYILARRGWTCLDATTISCSHCHARVVIHTSPDPDTMTILETRFNEKVVNGHGRKCSWSTRGCHEALLRIPLADQEMSLSAYQQRIESLNGTSDAERTILSQASSGFEEVPDGFSGLDKLALFGWSFTKQGTVLLLVCRDCHRRLTVPSKGSVDALEEHYDYCPWVSAETQGTESGWSLLMKHWIKANLPEVVKEITEGQAGVSDEDKDSREQVRQVRQKLGFV